MATALSRQLLKGAAIVATAIVLLFIAGRFIEVTLGAVVTGILYYLALPIVELLEKRRMPRVGAILLVFVFFITAISLLLLYIIPIVIEQLTSLASSVPEILPLIEKWADRIASGFGGQVSEQQLNELLGRAASSASELVQNVVASILGALANVFTILLVTVAGFVSAFYLLRDREKIREYLRRYVPESSRQKVDRIAERSNEVLSGFLRGQIIVALTVGTLVWIAMMIIGVPYAFILGVVAAVLEIVPYLGPILATIPAALLGLTVSPVDALFVILAFFLIQQIESLFLSPRIVGAHVHLHPASVIFAVLIGNQIIGLLGIFVAIPTAGVTKVFIEELLLPPPERQPRREEKSRSG